MARLVTQAPEALVGYGSGSGGGGGGEAPADTAFAAAVMVAVGADDHSQSPCGQIHRPIARGSPLAAPQPLLQPPFAAPFFFFAENSFAENSRDHP